MYKPVNSSVIAMVLRLFLYFITLPSESTRVVNSFGFIGRLIKSKDSALTVKSSGISSTATRSPASNFVTAHVSLTLSSGISKIITEGFTSL